jgi:hypothetical protein
MVEKASFEDDSFSPKLPLSEGLGRGLARLLVPKMPPDMDMYAGMCGMCGMCGGVCGML